MSDGRLALHSTYCFEHISTALCCLLNDTYSPSAETRQIVWTPGRAPSNHLPRNYVHSLNYALSYAREGPVASRDLGIGSDNT
jgi:hypothetical protein